MTKKSKMTLALASMLGITAGATAVSGFAWFTTTKSATVDITNIGVYSKSSALDVVFKEAVVGCTNNGSTDHDINVIGDVAGSTKTETIPATSAEQKKFEFKAFPGEEPTAQVKIGDAAATAATVANWDPDSREIELATAPGLGAKVIVTYKPFASLTDVSSVDGQKMYKPVWTASGEGRYATGIERLDNVVAPAEPEGYLQFTMTITASGASPLAVYLDDPHINAADDTDADNAAAARARVALIEGTTTKLVLQNDIDVAANNKGIDADYVSTGKTASYQGATVYDLNTLSASVNSSVLAEPDDTNKKALSDEPTGGTPASNNFVTTVPAAGSVDITVTVWLEGTSGIDANGKFALSPENGMINVSLPLIAF